MRIHHLLAVPAALALLLAPATSSAQDRPKAGTPLTSKTTKSTTQTPLQRNAAKPKAAKEGTVAKKVAPAATQSKPAEEIKESGCHSPDRDA